jgi:cation diffusion facilitator CzcD-associated flavoprotein CzcO
VTNRITGETLEHTAGIVISARGGLNQIAWPDIKGLKSFGGKLIHSGAWDERLGKKQPSIGEGLNLLTTIKLRSA